MDFWTFVEDSVVLSIFRKLLCSVSILFLGRSISPQMVCVVFAMSKQDVAQIHL